MATKILRVFQEFTSEGYVPMPIDGNIDYGYTIAGTFPSTTPATFQTDDPDLEVTVTTVTDFYVWIRSHGTEWNYQYTRNVRVYPDSADINNVVMGIIIANLGNTVPYTGATQNVDLGEFGISGGYIHLDNTPTTAPTTPGTIKWNDVDGTADLILKGGNVTNQIGQEINKRVVNKTGAILNEADFRAVRIRLVSEGGAQGQRLAVVLAQADSDTNSATTIGLVTETIANNAEGFITLIGEVKEINTTGAKSYGGTETWVDGDILYLSPTHAGYLTNVKPQAPQHMIVIGFVSYAHAIHGKIDVKVDNGYELDELHNVKITTVAENDFLVYDSSLHVWENRQVIKTNGYVPYFDSTDLFKQSPIYSNATKVAIGTTTFIGTNKLTIGGGIWAEEATINDQALISTNTLNGDFYISRWSGTAWDVFQTYSASKVLFSKDIEATKFIKTGGLHTQFLMADGLTETITNLSIITGGGSGGTNDGYLTRWNGLQTIQNSLMYETSAGFIGFGTTSPFKKFTVQGGAISVYSSATNYGFMDTSNTAYSFTSANGFNFIANNLGTVATTRVEANGNWGFGVGTPSYKVDVNGDVNINGLYRVNGSQISTSNVLEGSNLYFTSNRVLNQVLTGLNPALAGTMTATDSLIEGLSKVQYQLNNKENTITAGTTAQYWRGDKTWQTLNTSIVPEGTNLYYTQARFDSAFGAKSTTNLSEGTNLYYTDARARASNSFVAGSGAYNSTTGVITIPTNTNQLTNGASFITLASLSAGSGISYNNTTGVIASTITQYTDAMARASISLTTSGTSGAATYNSTTGVLNIPQYQNALTNPITGTGTTNYLPKFTGASTLGNSLVYDDGTNIGIGTTTPARKLTVKTTGIESAIYIQSDSNQASTLYFKSLANAIYTPAAATNELRFYVGSTDRMTIDSTGNLGLGVTPSAWSTWTSLQISGNAVLSGYNNNTIVANNWYYNAGDKYISNGYVSLYQQGNGAHTWYTAPSGTAGTAISFTQAMTLDASGTLLIGQTSNTGKGAKINITQGSSNTNAIDIKSATGTTYAHYGTFANNTYLSQNYYYASGQNADDLTLGQAAIVLSAGTTTSNTAFIDFNLSNPGASNPSSLMRLNVSGNLSIGNTNNTYKLDVSGDGRFTGNLLITNSDARFNGGDSVGRLILGNSNTTSYISINGATNASPYVMQFIANSTLALTLASTGAATFSSAVSINGGFDGTGGKLISNGGIVVYGGAIANAPTAASVVLDQQVGGVARLMASGASTWNATLAINPYGGNVGIGTTSPTSKLTIYDSGNSSSGQQIRIGYTSSYDYTIGRNPSSGYLDFTGTNIAGSQYIGYTFNGYVGIATTSPSAQLHVATGSVIIGSAPSSVFKFNVNTTGSKFLSYWIPTLDGVATVGIMAHNGGGYTDQASMGYQATTHMFNLGSSLLNGGTIQVGGDINITGTFRVNGSPIGSGGGGVSGSGTAGKVAFWTGSGSTTSIGDTFASASISVNSYGQMMFGSISAYTDYTFSGNVAMGSLTAGTSRLGAYYYSGTQVYIDIARNGYELEIYGYNNVASGGVIQDGSICFSAYKQSTSSYIRQMKIKPNTVSLPSIPTSSSGLSAGDVYRDGSGYLRII